MKDTKGKDERLELPARLWKATRDKETRRIIEINVQEYKKGSLFGSNSVGGNGVCHRCMLHAAAVNRFCCKKCGGTSEIETVGGSKNVKFRRVQLQVIEKIKDVRLRQRKLEESGFYQQQRIE